MKHVIFTLPKMTPEQLRNTPSKPLIKVYPNQEIDIDEEESTNEEEESTTSTEFSENSTSDTPSEASDDSKLIETSQVHTVFNKTTHDEDDSSQDKHMTEFEPCKENGEQNIVQENKLLSTNFTVKIEN